MQSGIGREWLLPLGGKIFCLVPWLGSYAFLALERFLRIHCGPRLNLKGFDSKRPYYMQFTMDATPDEFFEILGDAIAQPIDPMTLLYPEEAPLFDKYDDILPVELTRRGFAHGVLDVEGMVRRVKEMVKTPHPRS